ncbi:MAG: hypothetical protein ACR2QC_08880 [Gammaproteobacteria bacterium]
MSSRPRQMSGARAEAANKKTFHSCEGRNLRRRIAAGNCTITAFGVEIPAFAGMEQGERRKSAAERRIRLRRRRFRSPRSRG